MIDLEKHINDTYLIGFRNDAWKAAALAMVETLESYATPDYVAPARSALSRIMSDVLGFRNDAWKAAAFAMVETLESYGAPARSVLSKIMSDPIAQRRMP